MYYTFIMHLKLIVVGGINMLILMGKVCIVVAVLSVIYWAFVMLTNRNKGYEERDLKIIDKRSDRKNNHRGN